MLLKRGQITQFVLVGIALFFVVMLLVYFKFFYDRELAGPEELAVPPQLVPVDNLIRDCVQTTLKTGIKLAGLQGGYTVAPRLSLETSFSKVAYWYYNGQKHIPPLEAIEKELNLFLESGIPLCFNEDAFPQFDIITGDVKAKTTIKDTYVAVEAVYPVTAEKSGTEYKLSKQYRTKIPVNLGLIYDVAKDIAVNEAEKPGSIDLSYLLNLNYDVTVLPQDDWSVLYSIKDAESVVEPYSFIFAYRGKQ